MPGTGDTLHGRDRWHPHFHAAAGGGRLEQLQQIPRGSPQRRPRRILALIKRPRCDRDSGGAVRVGFAWWHESDRTFLGQGLVAVPGGGT
jgi:hypothetical protein